MPPAALVCPPPSKYFLAISFTLKIPLERKDSFTKPSISAIKTANYIPLIAKA